MQFCICHGGDDGRLMIQCDKCEEWFHADCVGLTIQEAEHLDHYYCPKCRPPRPVRNCANTACTSNATEASKYCSRKCGLIVARQRLNFLSQQKAAPIGLQQQQQSHPLAQAATTEHQERLAAADDEDRAELALLQRAKIECQQSMEKLNQAEGELQRALAEPQTPGMCTYPACQLTKAECQKHVQWAEIQSDQTALARREETKALEKIDQRQRFLHLRMERRRSLAAILFHRTQTHAPQE